MASRFQALTFIAEFWEQNSHLWFNATPGDDLRICELLEPFIDDFTEFSLATLPTTDLQQKVGWVILYDQILKHVNRHRTLEASRKNKLFTPYLAPDDLAEQCWQEFQEYYEPDIALTDFEFGFLLMPMRHTHQLSQVKLVLSAAWYRLVAKPPGADTTFMRNYIKATYTRHAKFISVDDPETWIDYPSVPSEHLHKFLMIHMNKLMDLWDSDKGYLDPQCYGNGGTNPQCYGNGGTNPQCYGPDSGEINVVTRLIPPTKEIISSDKLLTCMSSFVAANGIPRLPPTGTTLETPLVVSLSGGVDSMVCAYLLWALDVPFRALHVNYSNRDSDVCAMEEFLVRYYCALLGIHLRVVRTDEINRPRCMEHGLREVYESYTRDRRFNGYLSMGNLNDELGLMDGARHIAVKVVLGHNQDDTIENILTNLAGQSHYDNLRGMTPVSEQTHRGRQIQFLRPLLGIAKRDIYAFANEHRIPYLVDSTPKWSQRGKIRDIVRPALESWNPEILGALQILADRLTDMTRTLDAVIPSANTNNGTGETITFAGIHQVPRTQSYWSRVFKGIPITQKTLREWIDKLNFLEEHPAKLVINQPIRFTLAKGRNLITTLTKDRIIKISIEIVPI